jgi:hypothetical protein
MIHASYRLTFETQCVCGGPRSQQAKGMFTTPSWAKRTGDLVIPPDRGSVKEPKRVCFQGKTGGTPHPICAPSELNGPS